MSTYPSVTRYMATKLVTFHPETEIFQAINTMLKRKISGAPVVDDKGNLVGMLSEVDCLQILTNGPYNKEPEDKGTVGDFMSSKVITINADKTILDAAYEFVQSGKKRLPVMENGKLVGQISRVDVLRAVQSIKPHVEHVPDSWRKRLPRLSKNKSGQYTENA